MASCEEERKMIEIRALTSIPEFKDAVRLQQEIWGFEAIELLPVRLFVVATKIGGQAFGAYDGGRMAGFCLAIPGLKAGGKSYLHSHMLGVLPKYRNEGVGRLLKLAQRQDLRSARDQERVFQYRTIGRGDPALCGEPVWDHHQPSARRTADGSLYRGMVDPDAASTRHRGRRVERAGAGGSAYHGAGGDRYAASRRPGGGARDSSAGDRGIHRRIRPRPGGDRI
jgi:GNAT superfamily N-acetyltransferase